MENNLKLVDDLENGDFLNEIIESNREMDSLLLESNFALEIAESELKATIKEPPLVISEEEDTSSALSIEVSEDLLKGYASDLKLSPIRSTSHSEDQKKQQIVVSDDLFKGYTSDLKCSPLNSTTHSEDKNEHQMVISDDLFKGYTSNLKFSPLHYSVEDRKDQQNSLVISDNLNNLLDDFNATLKSYNEVCLFNEKLNDNTICDQLNDDNDKTLVTEQNENEDENTKSSDANKFVQIKSLVALNSEDEYDYLYADMYNTTLEITVPNTNENVSSSPTEEKLKHQDHFEGCSQDFDSKNVGNKFTVILNTESTATNDCKLITTGTEDFISSELSNDFVNKTSEQTTPECDFTSDDINFPFLNVYEPELKNYENSIVDEIEKISDTITGSKKENLIKSELKNENSDLTSDIAPETIDEVVKNDTEITTNDMSVTFYNFIQSNTDNINLRTDNCDLLQNNNILNIPEIATEKDNFTINENNNKVSLKRPAEDITVLESDSKRQKVDAKSATVTSAIITETAIEINEDPTTEINFTQAIFDAEETADHNDPKWSELKDLETNEDYFKSVRTQWRSLSLSNPHKSLTTRYVPETIANIKPETSTSSENEKIISCDQFLNNRMKNISKEINNLVAKLNHMPRFKSRAERNRIHNELEQLRNLQHEVEKNQEEVKHINMFYYNEDQGWNANYLTRSELEELKEQDQVIQFQKTFYKSN